MSAPQRKGIIDPIPQDSKPSKSSVDLIVLSLVQCAKDAGALAACNNRAVLLFPGPGEGPKAALVQGPDDEARLCWLTSGRFLS